MRTTTPDSEDALLGALERQRALLNALRLMNESLDAGDLAPGVTAAEMISARAELLEALAEGHAELCKLIDPDTYGRARPAPAPAAANGAEAAAP